MDPAADLSMYQLMFDIADRLCQRYPALTPFQVRRERYREVMLLVSRVTEAANRSAAQKPAESVWCDSNGDKHIRRPARDDSWF